MRFLFSHFIIFALAFCLTYLHRTVMAQGHDLTQDFDLENNLVYIVNAQTGKRFSCGLYECQFKSSSDESKSSQWILKKIENYYYLVNLEFSSRSPLTSRLKLEWKDVWTENEKWRLVKIDKLHWIENVGTDLRLSARFERWFEKLFTILFTLNTLKDFVPTCSPKSNDLYQKWYIKPVESYQNDLKEFKEHVTQNKDEWFYLKNVATGRYLGCTVPDLCLYRTERYMHNSHKQMWVFIASERKGCFLIKERWLNSYITATYDMKKYDQDSDDYYHWLAFKENDGSYSLKNLWDGYNLESDHSGNVKFGDPNEGNYIDRAYIVKNMFSEDSSLSI